MSSTRGKTAFNWDLYSNRAHVLSRFRETKEYVDALLESEEGTAYPVHLVVVSGLGKQITQFMYKQISDAGTLVSDVETANGKSTVRRIKFPQMKADTLEALIDWAYTGELRTDVTRVWDVLEVAGKFGMKDVISTCCSFLCRHVSSANCVEMYRVGKSQRHPQLIEVSLTSMRRDIENIVKRGPFFPTIVVNDLKAMLCADDLGTICEEFVWEAIKGWIMTDCDARQGSVDYLLTALRFHRTNNSFLRSLITDPLIQSERRRGRSQVNVEKMLHEKTCSYFTEDGRRLPVALEPESVRPRIPNAVMFGIGGWKGGRTTNLIETYDKSTNMWFELDNDRNTGPAHAYYGHHWLKDKIYMFGGTDGRNIKSSVISFNPESLEWKTLNSMSSKRCYVATAVLNGLVYAIGGHNGDHRLRTVEKYDLERDEWTAVADMNIARSDAGCAIVDGKIYVLGGLNEHTIEASVEYYDPVTDKWTMSQEMSTPRTSLAAVALNDQIYVLGGNRGDSRLSSCEKFDPLTSTWSPIKRMIDKRSTFSACVMDNKIFVVGGYDGHQPFGRSECYDPVSDSWTAIHSLHNPRSGLALVKVTGIGNGANYTFCGNQKTSLLR